MDIKEYTRNIYKKYGQSKSMDNQNEPCFFLHRNFKGEQDLLIIFKTPPCQSNCKYCGLSSKESNCSTSLCEQFTYVINEMRHSLSILDRITLSNNGSMLNTNTVSRKELMSILDSIAQIKNISRVVIETDLKFINDATILELKNVLPGIHLNFLTGFETLNEKIMQQSLGKYRNSEEFEKKLSILAKENCELTSYILYKPDQFMDDEMAYQEAIKSIEYLECQCKKRNLPLTIRINPMFAAKGTIWGEIARNSVEYSPPKLSDIFSLAKEIQKRISVYIGLSLEEKNEPWGSYRVHSDVTKKLILDIIRFNTKE